MNKGQNDGLATSPKAKEKSLWLGMSDIKTEGNYLYESTNDPFDISRHYHNFNAGEPNNNDCVFMKETLQYKWAMDNCHNSHHYVCEKPLVDDQTIHPSKITSFSV